MFLSSLRGDSNRVAGDVLLANACPADPRILCDQSVSRDRDVPALFIDRARLNTTGRTRQQAKDWCAASARFCQCSPFTSILAHCVEATNSGNMSHSALGLASNMNYSWDRDFSVTFAW